MNWLDKYRFYIIGFLILVILAGVAVLLWQKKDFKKLSNNKKEIRVDIAGGIKKPGVYSLKVGAILEDAVQAASGFSEDADIEKVAKEFNRAEILKDGQKIYIPLKGETNQNGNVAGAQTDVGPGTQTSSQKITGKINLNTASVEELDTLPGIGPAYAQQIIDYREANGGFSAIEEIMEIKGIGEKTFEKIKDMITI